MENVFRITLEMLSQPNCFWLFRGQTEALPLDLSTTTSV